MYSIIQLLKSKIAKKSNGKSDKTHATSIQDQDCFTLFPMLSEEVQVLIISCLPLPDLLSFSRSSRDNYAMVKASKSIMYDLIANSGFLVTPSIKSNNTLNLETYLHDISKLCQSDSFQWNPIEFKGSFPTKRYKHTSCIYKQYVVFIGGQRSNSKRYGDIYYYDTKNEIFVKPEIRGDLPPRFSRHTAQVIDDKVYIFGGYNGNGTYYNLATYNLRLKKWKNIPQDKIRGDIPPSRSNHSSAVVGSKYYIFSGNNTTIDGEYRILEDFCYLDTKTLTWNTIEATGEIPCGRGGHCMEVVNGKIYLFGGGVWHPSNDWTVRFNDIHIYDPETNHWSKPELGGTPPNTSTFTTSFVYGRFIILFGGGCQNINSVTNQIYALDTMSLSWINLSFINTNGYEPKARDMSTASLIGNNVYVFGGYSGGPVSFFDKVKFNFQPINNSL